MPQWKRKFEYKWQVGNIMMLTKDVSFENSTLPEGSIVKIYSRNQGYNCNVLRPTVFAGEWCCRVRMTDHDALREISNQEWISILNA